MITTPSPYQMAVFHFIRDDLRSLIVEAAAGSGKEQPINSIIQTPSGQAKIGDLVVGDTIFAANGKHQTITGVFPQGVKPNYKVTFNDSTSTHCGIDHLWALNNKGICGNSTKVLSLKEILDIGLTKEFGGFKHRIPLCQPVDYPTNKLPIHPYLMGLMIVDGKTPVLSFNKNDVNIIHHVKFLCNGKFDLNIHQISNDTLQTAIVPINKTADNSKNWLMSEIKSRDINVSQYKFIPESYLYGDIQQRTDLLHGLMDSDGSCRTNQTTFSSTSSKLIDNVSTLVQSLGGTTIRHGDHSPTTRYSLNIKINTPPFGVSKKNIDWSPSIDNPPSRYITNVQYMGEVEQVCISVDSPDSLYLTDNFIVTHNTTTIVGSVKLIPDNLRTMFCAFNKSIATELATKLPNHVNCCTLNSLGHRAWMRHVDRRAEINVKKTYDLLDHNNITNIYERSDIRSVRFVVNQLVGFAKQIGLVPANSNGVKGLVDDTDGAWYGIIQHHNVDMNVKRDGKTRFEIREETKRKTELAIELARKVLKMSIQQKTTIDFNDQLYLPVIYGAKFPQNDVIFVDEAQDISHIQRVMLRRSLKEGGRLIAVGDPCQPTGTMVTVVENKKHKFHGGTLVQKSIEDLNEGDLVVTYNMEQGRFIRGREIKGITKREYQGVMINVLTDEGHFTRYTPNHHCIVNFEPLRDKFIVYMMANDNRVFGDQTGKFRIGVCKMDYGNSGSGLCARLKAENAEQCWILSIHDTKEDALYRELELSTKFNIPMVRFQDNSKSAVFNQDTLDKFWGSQIFGLFDRAKHCLASVGKDIRYPLINNKPMPKFHPYGKFEFSHSENEQVQTRYNTLKRPIITHAINLETGCKVLPYYDEPESYKTDWVTIEVTPIPYQGDVYSMDIDQEHTYIGDGIATHNCQAIYGFRGADSESLNNIARDFNAERLPLSISYRCAKDVVKEAQKYVSHIEAHDGAPEGKIEQLGVYERRNMDIFQPEDFVLCRNVAPLIKLAFALIAAGKPVGILGKDIGKNISSLIEKLKAKNIKDLRKKLMAWEKEEIERLQARDPDASGERIIERADSVRTFINCSGADTVQGVLESIDSLFSDNIEGAVHLSTIHKSKGLEADRVIILDRHLIPSKYAVHKWQKEQENNLIYVAVTRSINYLGFINSPETE